MKAIFNLSINQALKLKLIQSLNGESIDNGLTVLINCCYDIGKDPNSKTKTKTETKTETGLVDIKQNSHSIHSNLSFKGGENKVKSLKIKEQKLPKKYTKYLSYWKLREENTSNVKIGKRDMR